MSAAPEGGNRRPIIIKRVEEAHGGHHGGAWKVAYADFVTAMMAFFLLLWLLGATTEEQRSGIADYFSPTTAASVSMSGSGGVMGGLTISVDGPMASSGSLVAAPGVPSGLARELGGDPDAIEAGQTDGTSRLSRRADHEAASAGADQDGAREAAAREEEIERERFREAERELREALAGLPELDGLSESVRIDHTPEGLRIQIVDHARYSMFPSGSAQMPGRTAELLALVTRAIADLPNRVSIRGHTDARPFPAGSGRDNWILSAERANATRLAMIAAGLAPTRLANVVGLADTEPLVTDQPLDPQNRRLSIILLAARREG
jgi:chemotaxis protein MotB